MNRFDELRTLVQIRKKYWELVEYFQNKVPVFYGYSKFLNIITELGTEIDKLMPTERVEIVREELGTIEFKGQTFEILEVLSDKKFERSCQCGSYARLHRYLGEGNRMECINCYRRGAFSDTDEGAVEEWENGHITDYDDGKPYLDPRRSQA